MMVDATIFIPEGQMPLLCDLAIGQYFATVDDPRVDRTKDHALLAIIIIAICAVICGADGWVEVGEFGKTKRDWLATFLALPNGISSHDTFGRVFARIDLEQFQQSFLCAARWQVCPRVKSTSANHVGRCANTLCRCTRSPVARIWLDEREHNQ